MHFECGTVPPILPSRTRLNRSRIDYKRLRTTVRGLYCPSDLPEAVMCNFPIRIARTGDDCVNDDFNEPRGLAC